jgi:hypothetical protein
MRAWPRRMQQISAFPISCALARWRMVCTCYENAGHTCSIGVWAVLRISMPFFWKFIAQYLAGSPHHSSDSNFLHTNFLLDMLKSSKQGFECLVGNSISMTAIQQPHTTPIVAWSRTVRVCRKLCSVMVPYCRRRLFDPGSSHSWLDLIFLFFAIPIEINSKRCKEDQTPILFMCKAHCTNK